MSLYTPDAELRWGTRVVEEHVLGSPCRNLVPRLQSLTDLAYDAEVFSDREYLVQGATRVTFAQHEAAVEFVARRLRDLGVKAGDRVLMFAANSTEWVIAFWAIVNIGAVVVLGNGWWSDDELAHALAVARPRLVLSDQRLATRVPASQLTVDLADYAESVLAPPRMPRDQRIRGKEDDPVVILFTSGTTGFPKGAALSHRGLIATLHATLQRTHRLPQSSQTFPARSSSLMSLPLFHVGGLQQLLIPMVTGGTLVFTEGRFDPAAVVRLIRDNDINVWSTVPTMVTQVLDYLDAKDVPPLSSVRTIALGGAPVHENLRARVPSHFPNVQRRLAVTYGLSEAGGTVTTGAGEEILERPGTVGRPLITAQIRISEPDVRGYGRIEIRAPFVMLGYLDEDGEVSRGPDSPISNERWLDTGDVGWLDDGGYLYVTDRLKDVVIRGGENIATLHVEDALLAHPAVRQAAVLGVPHDVLGEELAAVIVLQPGARVSETELRSFLELTLAHFEIPSRWALRDEPLPVNPAGKVSKRVLREEFG